MKIGWRFPPLSGGTRQGYTNNDIEVFKGQELIDNLAREICQNSLDAAIDESKDPVKVVFELKTIKKDEYDVFKQYSDCLDGCRKYWGDEMDDKLSKFVAAAEDTLKKEYVDILIASDHNTKGLIGSRGRKIKCPWEALTSSDGVSVKKDKDSGGSYGIGKNAPFACSALSMVFYNTFCVDGERAFIGVARLATLLNSDQKATQRVGRYQKNDDANERWEPIYAEDENKFRDFFKRTDSGTDVIVVGFSQTESWMKNVTNAVLKNFFVAIAEKKLVVELRDKEESLLIDSSTIDALINDVSTSDGIVTLQLYKAFVEPACKSSFSILESNDVDVYVKTDKNYKRTIGNFRNNGMLVGKYYRSIFQHYAAVVVVRGTKLGELLLETEPPRHNRWDYKQIESNNKERRKIAKKAIEDIKDNVYNILTAQFENVTEETVDAVGVGEYLPDDVEGLNGKAEGDDVLRAKVKVGTMKVHKSPAIMSVQIGAEGEGIKQDGDVRNHETNPEPVVDDKEIKPVVEDDPGPNRVKGIKPGNGTKDISSIDMSSQRAFSVNAGQGIYKIVMVPKNDCDKLYVQCSAVGEDGVADSIALESFKCDGKTIKINGAMAGPISVKAGSKVECYAIFANKEKMILKLNVTGEVVK